MKGEEKKTTRLGGFFFCIKVTKKIFFAVYDKDSNSNGKTVLDDVSLVY